MLTTIYTILCAYILYVGCMSITEKAMNGDDDQMRSPTKSDTLRSTDSASGGETLEERSSKEVTQQHVDMEGESKRVCYNIEGDSKREVFCHNFEGDSERVRFITILRVIARE